MKVKRIIVVCVIIIVVPILFLLSGCSCSQGKCTAMNSTKGGDCVIEVKDSEPSNTAIAEQTMVYPIAKNSAESIRLTKILPDKIPLNQMFDYCIKAKNVSDVTMHNVRVKDVISPNMMLINSTPRIDTMQGTDISWLIPVLKPGTEISINAKAVATGGNYIESAAMVDYDCLVCSSISVIESRLKLVKYAPKEVSSCDTIIVDYEITNQGTTAVEGLVLTEKFEPGLITPEGESAVEFELSALPPGKTRRFTQTINALIPGSYTGRAMLCSSDGTKVESNITKTAVTQPVLTLKEIYPDNPVPGNDTTLEFVISNIGDSTAGDTRIEAVLPDGVEFSGASDNGMLSDKTSSEVFWRIGNLRPNTSRRVTMTVKSTSPEILKTHAVAKADCANSVTSLSPKMFSEYSELLFYRPFVFE